MELIYGQSYSFYLQHNLYGSLLYMRNLSQNHILFFRKPHSLKDVLRPIRVSLGPVSIITSMTAASSQLYNCLFYELPAPGLGHQLLSVISSLLGMGSVLGAGIIFRPDNSAVLDLFEKVNLSYRDKVNYHAFFNGIVLIVAWINVVFENVL